MVERVKPRKIEIISTGGGEDDLLPMPVDTNEDHLDCRGITIQNDSSDNETVILSRDSSDNMTFADGVVSGTKTLTELIEISRDKVCEFWDFVRETMDTTVWTTSVSGSGSTITIATDKQYGEVIMEGNATGGHSAFVLKSWSNLSINVADNFEVSWRVKAVDDYSLTTLGLIASGNDQILMYKWGSANWKVHTYSGGVGTTTDTGVAQDGNYHIFKIVGSTGNVKFYIDDTLEATHTTNVPTVDLTIETKLDMLDTNQVYFYCDWIELKCDR